MDCDAWAAGLIEGEGYIGLSQNAHHKTYRQAFVKVQMTDEDIITRLAAHFNCGTVKRLNMDIPSRQGKKQVWNWTVGKYESVKDILDRIYPWLGKRRKERADEVLLYIMEQQDKRRKVSLK